MDVIYCFCCCLITTKVGNLQNVYKFELNEGNTKGENKEMTRALQAENNVSYCMPAKVAISGVHEPCEATTRSMQLRKCCKHQHA